MLIEITYNVTDVYMSTTETPVYVEISFEQPGSTSAVWGSITGTLSNQTDLQNALNLKVPYTGATTNVNLGEYELKAGQVTLDTSPTGTAAVGTIRWNDTTGTSETSLKGGNVIIKNGVDLVARVVNKVSPNTTLTKAAYQAVRVSGAQGQRLAIELAQANNDAGSADTIGLVTETIAPNQEGFIMTVGQLEGINTTGSLQGETWVDGDVLYLSPTTAGAITNVKPTGATGHLVIIGYVEYAHANNGKLYIKVANGFEIDELHNVSIVTPSNNQGLFYNSSNSLWENKTISTALGYTPVPTTRNITINGVTYDLSADRTYTISTGISGSGAAGQVTYWDGTSSVSGSNNLFWDNANGRLGIGTNVPAYRLHNVGTSGFDNGNSGDAVTILNTGFLRWADVRFRGFSNSFHFQDNAYNSKISFSMSGSLSIFNTGGNFSFGTSSDLGVRLGVVGDTLLRGSGNTSATTALTVQNSDSTNLLRVRNDGALLFSNGSDLQIYSQQNSARSSNIGSGFAFQSSLGSGFAGPDFRFFNGFTSSIITSGARAGILVNSMSFQPTSGTATYTILQLESLINQTGGANGITRGLYVNPTLTAAADWRSIEWSNNSGWGLYGAGTSNNYINGVFQIGGIPSTLTNTNFIIGKTFTNTTHSGSLINAQINNTVTSAFGYRSRLFTQGTGFTLPSISHFSAEVSNPSGTDVITNAYGFHATSEFVGATNNFGFYGNIPSGTGRWNLYMNSTAANFLAGNLGIGITPTVKLHVSGDTILKGSGATSATTALTVQNSDATTSFEVLNDGIARFRTSIRSTTGGSQLNQLTAAGTGTENGLSISATQTPTSGDRNMIRLGATFSPTSGGARLTNIYIAPTINQTGGSNGISKGLYIEPTLTAAADWRSIQWDNNSGWGLYGAGTANNYLGGNVAIGSTSNTSDWLNIAASTTAKAHIYLAAGVAPTSPNDGDIWFDGTDIKMRIGGVTKTFTLV